MSEKKLTGSTQGEPVPGEGSSAEAKRVAARRRFLVRGAATGGILTILHQRSYATGTGTKLIYVSSAATCTSLHGKPGNNVKMLDSITKKQVTRTECQK